MCLHCQAFYSTVFLEVNFEVASYAQCACKGAVTERKRNGSVLRFPKSLSISKCKAFQVFSLNFFERYSE